MPWEIVTQDGSAFVRRLYELEPLGPRDVRVRVLFASPKHGTELHALTGSAFDTKRWDPELRIFLASDEARSTASAPWRRVGNMVVGEVEECGSEVARWKVGDRVFGYGPIREEHQAEEGHWYPLENIAPEAAVCVDPAHVAFVAVRDGRIRIGDHVAVFGLGAIGLMAVEIARASGARRVIAVDPSGLRRDCALALGADTAVDPAAGDVGLAMKLLTDRQGVDVAIETSGSAAALHEAIRGLRKCGTVVHVPWGPRDCSSLRLDEEFHLNRPTIVGSQAWEGWECPDRDHPLWTHQRAFEATIELFQSKVVSGKGIVTPVVPFAEAADALSQYLARPDQAIKIGVEFAQ